jgi:hypothetical protein
MCECGIEEAECLHQQARAQSNEPHTGRIEAAADDDDNDVWTRCSFCKIAIRFEDAFSPSDYVTLCEACNAGVPRAPTAAADIRQAARSLLVDDGDLATDDVQVADDAEVEQVEGGYWVAVRVFVRGAL